MYNHVFVNVYSAITNGRYSESITWLTWNCEQRTVEQGSVNLCFVMLGTAFLTSDFKWTDNDFGNDNIVYLLVRLM